MAMSAENVAEIDHATATLVVGEKSKEDTLQAVVHVTLADTFKTYWFMPGDGGLPPYFSSPQGKTHIHLPAPKRIIDEYGNAVGYKEQVSIPLTVKLSDEQIHANRLNLNMTIGVCADICIPFIAELSADVPQSGTMMPRQKFKFDDAFRALPAPFSEAFQPHSIALKTNDGPTDLQLTFNVKMSDEMKSGSLSAFAAVRDDGNFFSHASTVKKTGDEVQVAIPVSSAMGVEHFSGKSLTLVLVSGDQAVEGVVQLP